MKRAAEPRSPVERFIQDPAGPGILLMAVMVLGGFVALWFGWRAVARTVLVPLQLPGILSGGLAGLALIAVGTALMDLQVERRHAAEERRRTDQVLDELAGLRTLAPVLGRRLAKARAGAAPTTAAKRPRRAKPRRKAPTTKKGSASSR